MVPDSTKTPLQAARASANSTLQVTTTSLPPFLFNPPRSVADLKLGGPSEAGHSVVSTYLECPERARLQSLKLVPKVAEIDMIAPLTPLLFGSLIHGLCAYRIVAGTQAALALLQTDFEDLHPDDRNKAFAMISIYDQTFPLEDEPFEYLGVEVPVYTEIAPGIVRTARYDGIVRHKLDGAIFSLEKKTASRGGATAMTSYRSQMGTQQALWNANPALVEKYGPMRGVIGDLLVKTQVPQAERVGPFDFSPIAQKRLLQWMASPNYIRYPVDSEGAHHRGMSLCWGKWGPCPYIDGCWDDAWGNYEIKQMLVEGAA